MEKSLHYHMHYSKITTDMKLILGVANVSFLHSISSPKAISAAEYAQAKKRYKKNILYFPSYR